MRLIGLCGKSGSGKGVFASVAAGYGVKVIDCDRLYADLVSRPTPCLKEIAAAFGEKAVKDGALDRGYMAPLVFSDPKKLQKLNRIAHKHVKAELKKLFAGFGAEDIVLLDAPTLFESGLDSECDLIISVIAPEEACLERIIERDGIGREAALMRLVNQHDDDFFIENGDIVVYNDGTPEEFAEAAGEIIGSIVRDGI